MQQQTLTTKNLHFVVPLFNRGSDLTKLIDNLRDTHCHIWIGDFSSTDVDWPTIITPGGNACVWKVSLPGNFNIAKAYCEVAKKIKHFENAILVFIDADTVFDNPQETCLDILRNVKRGETYYCPNVSTQSKPTKWKSEFNGSVYVPTEDPRGFGLCAVFRPDFALSGEYFGTEFLEERGEYWGQHDTYLMKQLETVTKLKPIRPTLSNVWLRTNNRDKTNKWYSKAGGKSWFEK